MDLIVTSNEALELLLAKVINERLQSLPVALPGEPSEIINTETLCQRLNVSEPTIIRMRKKKKIPFMLIGSSVRYNYPDVVKALSK